MFADYQKQVLLTYREKKAANQLSLNLTHPTPGKLRRECIAIFSERYQHHHDEKTLRIFFGSRDNAAAYMQAINTFETDKFRPLDKFLKGLIADTDEKNIELLAWLIDFEYRPYQWTISYANAHKGAEKSIERINPLVETREQKAEAPLPGGEDVTPGAPIVRQQDDHADLHLLHEARGMSGKKILKSKYRNAVVILIILAIGGRGIYLAGKKIVEPDITGKENCMFWAGDHYQPVSCNQKVEGSAVYALDTLKTKQFKRITTPDTLTTNSLGHVWYSKIDGTVEFYTADGFHPIHTEKRLKLMTELILNKYSHRN